MQGKYNTKIGVRGIIIKDHKILLVRQTNRHRHVIHLLPGGGVYKGEDIKTAVRREVLEETSLEVEPEDVWFIREMISPCGKTYEFIFKTNIIRGNVHLGFDPEQEGLEPKLKSVGYYPVDHLCDIELYPTAIRKLIPYHCKTRSSSSFPPVFLGKEIFE